MTTTLKESDALKKFKRGISSKSTEKVYGCSLSFFMRINHISDYDELAHVQKDMIEVMFENFIDHMCSIGSKNSTIRTHLVAIERFFDMNGREDDYQRRRIRRSVKKDLEQKSGGAPITTEEIARMLSFTRSARTKALVHFFACTGIRPGALNDPVLVMSHLEDMGEGFTSIKIYDGSNEEYWAFLTPETTLAFQDYFTKREASGETLTESSPVFCNEMTGSRRYKPLSKDSVYVIIQNLTKIAGIKRVKRGERYNKATTYMFRKRFNTIMKIENSVNSNIAEKLMGHKSGLDGVYLKPTREECFKEFRKAAGKLTIDPTARQQLEITAQKNLVDKLRQNEKRTPEKDKKMEILEAKVERLEHTIYMLTNVLVPKKTDKS